LPQKKYFCRATQGRSLKPPGIGSISRQFFTE
jgi:hypothetical protein